MSPSIRPPGVLFVGLDAMDADLASRLAREGRMPAFADLLGRAAQAVTENPAGFYVGGVWPSFTTALHPSRHGQYCWKQFDPATYLEPPPPYDDGEGEPFWAPLDRAGRRCLVLDVPRSIVQPLGHGVAVHDFGAHDPIGPGFATSPAPLAEEIRAEFGEPFDLPCDSWPRSTAEEVRDFVRHARRRIETKTAIFERLLERGPFDLGAIGFADAHCAGHQLWHQHDPSHRRHDAALARETGDPFVEVYEALDGALARVLALAGPATRVLVLASHGMGPHYDGCHLLDRLVARMEAMLPGLRPLPFGERLRRLRARSNRPRVGWKRIQHRWPRRRFRAAFQVSNNEAWAGVRLNLEGREAHGRIESGAYDAARDRLVRVLETVRNGTTGGPAFRRVLATADVYRGSRLPLLPDVIAEWTREAPFDALEAPGLGRVEGRCDATRTGDHRPHGLALARGPGIDALPLHRPVPVVDLAPTLCRWMGVPLADVDGRPVPEWTAGPDRTHQPSDGARSAGIFGPCPSAKT